MRILIALGILLVCFVIGLLLFSRSENDGSEEPWKDWDGMPPDPNDFGTRTHQTVRAWKQTLPIGPRTFKLPPAKPRRKQ